jgi:hydrogenase/urease accessory protein HupE
MSTRIAQLYFGRHGLALRAAWLLLVAMLGNTVFAHDARPVAVTITETLPGLYQVLLRAPPTVEQDNIPVLVWPASCAATDDTTGGLVRCDGTLAGQNFTLDYPAFNPSLATYYRLLMLDGTQASAMLAPTEAVWTVPEAMTTGRVAREYLLLGIEHIIGGLDHLLFVLGLLVIARTAKRILLTVTGFTLAHSITLSLSALGVISIPIVPVEAAIALSILFLAHEISRQRKDSLTWRYPLLVSFGFGLLHGLGFASALGEIGLVQNEVLVSLLFFNLGVEAGQIAFIFAVMALVLLLRKLLVPAAAVTASGILAQRSELLAAYVIGVPSAYWLIERVSWFLV